MSRIIDLDALASVKVVDNATTKAFAGVNQLILQSASLSLARTMPSFQQVLSAYVEPMRRVAEIVQEGMKKILENFRQTLEAVARSLRYLLNWKPLIYVTPPQVVNRRLDRHLTISISPHGYFVLGGKTIFKLHSRTSRVGRFLHCLLLAMSEVVAYEEIQAHIGSGDRQKAFKDLKYKLKQEGYELDYTLVRTEGIALNGVIAIS